MVKTIIKSKTILSLLLCMTMVFSLGATSMSASAASIADEEISTNDTYNFYRQCDNATGIILEKYDTEINGDNNVDYFELATSMSSEKSDRIAAMNFITVIYDYVNSAEKATLKSYIKSYAPYTDEANLHSFCERLADHTKARSTSAYSAEAAVEYANQYWQNYNPAYPDLNTLGGDCANFVSQCLYAGGKQMNGDWYIYQKNDTYMSPANTTQLNASWDLADPSPWISAEEFNNYWSDYCSTYEYTLSNYQSNHTSVYNSGNVKAGDVLLLLERVLWWYEGNHVMIIVGLDSTNTDFIYAGHSNNRIDGTILGNICASYGSSYKIKFFSIS